MEKTINEVYCSSVQNFISACCDWFEIVEGGVSFRFVDKHYNETFFLLTSAEFAEFLTYDLLRKDHLSETAFKKVLSNILPHVHSVDNLIWLFLQKNPTITLDFSHDLFRQLLKIRK